MDTIKSLFRGKRMRIRDLEEENAKLKKFIYSSKADHTVRPAQSSVSNQVQNEKGCHPWRYLPATSHTQEQQHGAPNSGKSLSGSSMSKMSVIQSTSSQQPVNITKNVQHAPTDCSLPSHNQSLWNNDSSSSTHVPHQQVPYPLSDSHQELIRDIEWLTNHVQQSQAPQTLPDSQQSRMQMQTSNQTQPTHEIHQQFTEGQVETNVNIQVHCATTITKSKQPPPTQGQHQPSLQQTSPGIIQSCQKSQQSNQHSQQSFQRTEQTQQPLRLSIQRSQHPHQRLQQQYSRASSAQNSSEQSLPILQPLQTSHQSHQIAQQIQQSPVQSFQNFQKPQSEGQLQQAPPPLTKACTKPSGQSFQVPQQSPQMSQQYMQIQTQPFQVHQESFQNPQMLNQTPQLRQPPPLYRPPSQLQQTKQQNPQLQQVQQHRHHLQHQTPQHRPQLLHGTQRQGPQLHKQTPQQMPQLHQQTAQQMPQLHQQTPQQRHPLHQETPQQSLQQHQQTSQQTHQVLTQTTQQRPQVCHPTPHQPPQLHQPTPQQRFQLHQPAPEQMPQLNQPTPQQMPQPHQSTKQATPQVLQQIPQQRPQVIQQITQQVPQVLQQSPQQRPQVPQQTTPQMSQLPQPTHQHPNQQLQPNSGKQLQIPGQSPPTSSHVKSSFSNPQILPILGHASPVSHLLVQKPIQQQMIPQIPPQSLPAQKYQSSHHILTRVGQSIVSPPQFHQSQNRTRPAMVNQIAQQQQNNNNFVNENMLMSGQDSTQNLKEPLQMHSSQSIDQENNSSQQNLIKNPCSAADKSNTLSQQETLQKTPVLINPLQDVSSPKSFQHEHIKMQENLIRRLNQQMDTGIQKHNELTVNQQQSNDSEKNVSLQTNNSCLFDVDENYISTRKETAGKVSSNIPFEGILKEDQCDLSSQEEIQSGSNGKSEMGNIDKSLGVSAFLDLVRGTDQNVPSKFSPGTKINSIRNYKGNVNTNVSSSERVADFLSQSVITPPQTPPTPLSTKPSVARTSSMDMSDDVCIINHIASTNAVECIDITEDSDYLVQQSLPTDSSPVSRSSVAPHFGKSVDQYADDKLPIISIPGVKNAVTPSNPLQLANIPVKSEQCTSELPSVLSLSHEAKRNNMSKSHTDEQSSGILSCDSEIDECIITENVPCTNNGRSKSNDAYIFQTKESPPFRLLKCEASNNNVSDRETLDNKSCDRETLDNKSCDRETLANKSCDTEDLIVNEKSTVVPSAIKIEHVCSLDSENAFEDLEKVIEYEQVGDEAFSLTPKENILSHLEVKEEKPLYTCAKAADNHGHQTSVEMQELCRDSFSLTEHKCLTTSECLIKGSDKDQSELTDKSNSREASDSQPSENHLIIHIEVDRETGKINLDKQSIPEECPMCYTEFCPSNFTVNVDTFRITIVCVECDLIVSLVFGKVNNLPRRKKKKIWLRRESVNVKKE